MKAIEEDIKGGKTSRVHGLEATLGRRQYPESKFQMRCDPSQNSSTTHYRNRKKSKTSRSYKRSQLFLTKETNLGVIAISGFIKEPALEPGGCKRGGDAQTGRGTDLKVRPRELAAAF